MKQPTRVKVMEATVTVGGHDYVFSVNDKDELIIDGTYDQAPVRDLEKAISLARKTFAGVT